MLRRDYLSSRWSYWRRGLDSLNDSFLCKRCCLMWSYGKARERRGMPFQRTVRHLVKVHPANLTLKSVCRQYGQITKIMTLVSFQVNVGCWCTCHSQSCRRSAVPCSVPAADLCEYGGLMLVNVKMIKTSTTEGGSCASKVISWPAVEGRKCWPSVSLCGNLGSTGKPEAPPSCWLNCVIH